MRRIVLFLALLAACAEVPPAEYAATPEPLPLEPIPAEQIDPRVTSPEITIGAEEDRYADTDPSALTEFHAALDAHGSWSDDGTYGTVWLPSREEVGSDFTPYVTAGHWDLDDGEYVWVSDYPWGWAPFHYGRWVWIAGRGWAWIPGRAYAGAWVVWRTGGADVAYVGWAPMPPAWIWRGGVAVGIAVVPPAPFVFCARGDFFAPVVATRIVRDSRAPVVARSTRIYAPPVVARPPSAPIVRAPPPPAIRAVPRVIDSGVGRARQLARPSTARPLGAQPPTTHVFRPPPVRAAPRVVAPRR